MACWPRSAVTLALALAGAAACRGTPSRLDEAMPPADPGSVPLAGTPIAIDGEWSEPAWNQRALRGVLAGDDGRTARPYGELRLLHDADTLYVGLYAADEDIRSTDRWELVLGPRTLHVDAAGRADAPDVRAAVDRDGTLDRGDDYDEEWVIELAVPLAGLGEPPLTVFARRCDTPKSGGERCGSWHATLGLQSL